ncbi:sterile alpha motif domain-containing protein 9-like [Anabas testudineus]|uniref:sterile alpha motif domain-containing protein 9-like n=1 Tax=Anabas testudineus TaxID=64144 RepID=UPI000E460A08|nr:sterile alpha motif domain-containing protein 9-like [Anabas testudineus]
MALDESLNTTMDPAIRDEAADEAEQFEIIKHYVQNNRKATNTQLFSFLALLNAYVPESYLLMSECQQFLGPPDPIHGGPPFEKRMEPFSPLIGTYQSNPEHICMMKSDTAQKAVKLLADLGFSRSTIVKELISSLCGDQVREDIIQYIKDLLTKREMIKHFKEKFSRLIIDIIELEKKTHHAVSVLKKAAQKFRQQPIFPQTLSRLYYNEESIVDYEVKAIYWANEAIKRAPNNSYVADTLGQIYKNCLRKAAKAQYVLAMAELAFEAFKAVEEKAEKEEGPEMRNTAGTVSISNSFNNRGLFGFIQVAQIAFKKLENKDKEQQQSLIQNKQMKVEANFDFFEWYLTYSKPDIKTLEPHYFWRDVALCYQNYTGKTAAESTSFPGLLDYLNHGLFMSKGQRAKLQEKEKNVSDIEEVQVLLKTNFEENVDSVEAAERYILSNIILSNKEPNSPHLTPMTELNTIICQFLDTEVGRRCPEFYLLVLLLFWPEERTERVQEQDDDEVEQQATEEDDPEDKTWEEQDSDEEQESREGAIQLPLDLDQYVTFMEKAFETNYAKHLRGRYLLPLFFLGKGSGLSKWIHKSKLDAIVEKTVDAELDADEKVQKKVERINDMWIEGTVWQLPEITNILLPVNIEPCQGPTTQAPEEDKEQQVLVCAGGQKIKATTEAVREASAHIPMRFYLGFTIRGPVVFSVGAPHMSQQ